MVNYNEPLLFQNKIDEIQLERAHYIELKKYSKKVYKREIITNFVFNFSDSSFSCSSI